jgi:crotonobetainyl-CoA:carnitine CoA-transferase CaiB-like acyl-CoA transferase
VPYQVFHTADQDVIIAVGSDKQWAQLCAVLDLGPAVRDDPRYANNQARLAHRAEVVALLQERLRVWPAARLLERLRAAEIPCGPINTVADTLADAHYQARGNVVAQTHPLAGAVRSLANPVRLADTPVSYRRPAPTLGEHSAEVLQELGYQPVEVDALRAAGII